MAVKKTALGKGLSALIEDTIDENKNSIIEVDINKVEPGPGQPRKNFDKEKIEALAASIKEYGMIQPLIVTKEKDVYYIIAGERRWRAARTAGFKTIPVIERSASTKEVMELALIENIQREDLNPIEEAEAYAKLIQEFSMTQEQVAEMVGKSRPSVANTLRLLNFSDNIRALLITGEITAGQARPILALENTEDQDHAAEYIIKTGLNARQTEQYIKKLIVKANKETESSDSERPEAQIKQQEIRFVQDQLRSSLGTKVLLNDNNGKGKITIEYYSKEERERLIDFLTKK
ncbi:MAG: ParB/RepB/Spo0J family partition protein [Clostridiales bacterium]|jgi:chromosome segregation DNA-binding protein|nr:ParB/RepB/Spo0J family partition protein [Clostridiales bacterium]